MTSEKHAKQTFKRFSKLDAIPVHTRMPFSFGSVLATLYVARRKTLVASVAIALAGITSYSFVAENETNVEIAVPTHSAAELPLETVKVITNEEKAEISAPPVVLPPANADSKNDDKTAQETKTASTTNANNSVTLNESDTVEVIMPPTPIRQIIPISEGLDLYRGPTELRNPKEEPAKNTAVNKQFSLPTMGVPSETDMQGFLGSASPEVIGISDEIAILIPDEDLSPTIALPDLVPFPVAKPTPPVADGQTVEFRIVQGKGVKSGFWIGNKDTPSVRRFFVIVKPFLTDGTDVNWKFTNIADGSFAETNTMAVEVTEEAFVGLAKESKEMGGIKDPVLGRGVTGKKDVKWRIPSVEGNLLTGWDKETRK